MNTSMKIILLVCLISIFNLIGCSSMTINDYNQPASDDCTTVDESCLIIKSELHYE